MFKHFIAALAALTLAAPIAALAQDAPSYASPINAGPADEQVHGRIVSFDGGYNLAVRDERGFVDNVQLHEGTIINPTGLTLEPGMIVNIMGYNAGQFLAANEIDTPYTYYSGVPYYAGHPWNYYGPSISLGFFFGNAGWWHGNSFRGNNFRFVGGSRVYNNVHAENIYHSAGGTIHGRDVVAPRERGGYTAHRAPQSHDGGGDHR